MRTARRVSQNIGNARGCVQDEVPSMLFTHSAAPTRPSSCLLKGGCFLQSAALQLGLIVHSSWQNGRVFVSRRLSVAIFEPKANPPRAVDAFRAPKCCTM